MCLRGDGFGGASLSPGLHRSVRKLLDTHTAIRLVLSVCGGRNLRTGPSGGGTRQEVSVEELVREMEGTKGWRLVDGCISVEGPGTARFSGPDAERRVSTAGRRHGVAQSITVTASQGWGSVGRDRGGHRWASMRGRRIGLP